MNAINQLLQTAMNAGRFCTGQVVISIIDAASYFPELMPFALIYKSEIAAFKKGYFPTSPKEPAAIYDMENLLPGHFMRLPKQYRRFFGRVDTGTGWRSFKGFDPQLGYKIAHDSINIRRGADSPWGMKWLSGQIYTSILTWAIHAEHIRRFGKLAPLPLPVSVIDIEKINWEGSLQAVESLNLMGNRNYPWTPGATDYCKQAREKIVSAWVDALPDTTIGQAIKEQMDPKAEGLGGVIYDMYPFLRLEMPVFFSADNKFQHTNYTLALERPLSEVTAVAEKTMTFIDQILTEDTEVYSKSRAENLGVLIGLCQELKINVLSFGVEASNIALDGSLPDLDTIQYRTDSIEWIADSPMPLSIDFRYSGILQNLKNFESLKENKHLSRLDDLLIENSLRGGLYSIVGGTYESVDNIENYCSPSTVMTALDSKLTVENTIRYPNLPHYIASSNMPHPEGFIFLRCKGTGNNPPEVWFTLAVVDDFAALEVHHKDSQGKYDRLPGDYFHVLSEQIPRSFLDYLEEYIRLFLSNGISEVVFYPEIVLTLKMEGETSNE